MYASPRGCGTEDIFAFAHRSPISLLGVKNSARRTTSVFRQRLYRGSTPLARRVLPPAAILGDQPRIRFASGHPTAPNKAHVNLIVAFLRARARISTSERPRHRGSPPGSGAFAGEIPPLTPWFGAILGSGPDRGFDATVPVGSLSTRKCPYSVLVFGGR